MHRDMAGARVPLHIVQSFLEDAVENQFGFGGQAFVQRRAIHLERHARPFHKLRVGHLQRRDQTQFVQFVGPQTAPDALHFFGSSADHLVDFRRVSTCRTVADRKFFRQRLAAAEDDVEKLGNVDAQFVGYASRSASCTCTTRCVKARSISSLCRASVMSVTTMPKLALSAPFFASGQLDICAGICEPSPALSSTWILGPAVSVHSKSGRSVARSSMESKW